MPVMRLRPPCPPVLLVAGFGVLVIAFLVGEPPFAGPDESAHYYRALSLTTDGLVGEPVALPQPARLSPRQAAVVGQEVRLVTVPAGLRTGNATCHVNRPHESAACLLLGDGAAPVPAGASRVDTPVGTYPPLAYALPGLAARLGGDAVVAVTLAAAASAATCLALLAAAVALLWRADAGPACLLGILVATTPMALSTAASMNPSGPEIAAAIAFGAATIALGRAPAAGREAGGVARSAGAVRPADAARSPGAAWAVVAAAGVVLVLSRSVGPAWLAVHLGVLVVWVGPRKLWRGLRDRPGAAVGAAAVLGLALVAAVAWQVVLGTDVAPAPGALAGALRAAWPAARTALARDAVAVFGYLEYGLPALALRAWQALVVGLIAIALAVGRGRRFVLLAVSVGAVLTPLVLEAGLLRHTGFAVQGRHVLAVLVLVPLLAGELVAERAAVATPVPTVAGRVAAVIRRLGPPVVTVAVGLVHLVAWYAVAHRGAVGIDGPWWFLGRSAWSPTPGYGWWALAAGSGAALVALAGLGSVCAKRQAAQTAATTTSALRSPTTPTASGSIETSRS